MSLVKLPFLLCATVGIHATMTPPHPAPSAEEVLKPTGLEVLGPRVPVLAKVGHWTVYVVSLIALFFVHYRDIVFCLGLLLDCFPV